MTDGLILKNICVNYKKPVIKNLSLEVKNGELCAVLGLNGSGKTTLLNAICGFVKSSGEVTVNGENVVGTNDYERARIISYATQRTAQKDGLTVFEVAETGLNPWLKFCGFPTGEQKKKVFEALQTAGVEDFAERDFSTLSEGEKQACVFARTLVQNCGVMLLDEPDSSLDVLNKRKLLSTLKTVVKEQKKAALITLHEPAFALDYADKVFLLKDGTIASTITPTNESETKIAEKLKTVYGEIEVVKGKNGFLVG